MHSRVEFTEIHPIERVQDHIQDLVRLDNAECLRTYTSAYQTRWGNVLAVTSLKRNDSLLQAWTILAGFKTGQKWVCDGRAVQAYPMGPPLPCDFGSVVDDPSHWTISNVSQCSLDNLNKNEPCAKFDAPIEYCLAEPTESHCTIRIYTTLLILVIVCNSIKMICLTSTVFFIRLEPLATIGDAISSFIQQPDPNTTQARLVASKFESQFRCRQLRWVSGVKVTRAVACAVL